MQASSLPGLNERYEIDLGEALQDWMEKDDVIAARRILRKRSPEEVDQMRQQQAAMQQAEMAARSNAMMDPVSAEATMDRIIAKSKKAGLYGKAQQVGV